MRTLISIIKPAALVIGALSALITMPCWAAASPQENQILSASGQSSAALGASSAEAEYRICAGDLIAVTVWNEDTLTQPKVLVRPDGYISMPLIGDVAAGGLSVQQLQQTLTERLIAFLKDKPIITVSVLQLSGNNIFVLGKVNRPGAYNMVSSLDVTQALALAGGLAVFADEDDIVILHRNEKGIQEVSKFPYDQIKNGKQLQANQILRSGDVIIVP